MATVELVYQAAAKIADAKDDPNSEVASYQYILDAKAGDIKVKTLAAQNIPRFFHLYPQLSEKAIDAQLDLVEDDELQIRLHAIQGIAIICQGSPSHVRRMALVLCQLLGTEKRELQVVKQTFHIVFSLDRRACFSAIFEQIGESPDDLKEKNVEYLFSQVDAKNIQTLAKDAELQTEIMEGFKKLITTENLVSLQQVDACLRLLFKLPAVKNDPSFVTSLSAVFGARAQLGAEFQPTDSEAIGSFCKILSMGIRNLKSQNMGEFLVYFLSKVVPAMEAVSEADRTSILKPISRCTGSITSELSASTFPAFFEFFREQLLIDEKSSNDELIQLECYLHLFHHLACKNRTVVKNTCGLFLNCGQPTDFVTPEIDAVRVDFVERMNAVVTILPKLLAAKKKATSAALKIKSTTPEEKKQNAIAATKATQAEESVHNVSVMLKALVARNPSFMSYQSQIKENKAPNLSWAQSRNVILNKRKKAGGKQQQGDQKSAKRVKGNNGGHGHGGKGNANKRGGHGGHGSNKGKGGHGHGGHGNRNQNQGGQRKKSKTNSNNNNNNNRNNNRGGHGHGRKSSKKGHGGNNNNNNNNGGFSGSHWGNGGHGKRKNRN